MAFSRDSLDVGEMLATKLRAAGAGLFVSVLRQRCDRVLRDTKRGCSNTTRRCRYLASFGRHPVPERRIQQVLGPGGAHAAYALSALSGGDLL